MKDKNGIALKSDDVLMNHDFIIKYYGLITIITDYCFQEFAALV